MTRGIKLVVSNSAKTLLKERIRDLYACWKAEKIADETRKYIQAEILDLMLDAEQKQVSFQEDGVKVKATYVANDRIEYDEERLKKLVGAKVWEKISTRRLDKAKLEAVLVEEELDSVAVASCTKIKHSPYVRFTEKKEPDEAEESGAESS